MTKRLGKRTRVGMAVAICAALTMFASVPAYAVGGTISCQGSGEDIVAGNTSGSSIWGTTVVITTNYSLKCGSVGNRARTNINGQVTWSSAPTLVSGNTYYRNYFTGTFVASRHYHNGTSNYLYA